MVADWEPRTDLLRQHARQSHRSLPVLNVTADDALDINISKTMLRINGLMDSRE